LSDGAFSVLSFRLSRDGTRITEHRVPTAARRRHLSRRGLGHRRERWEPARDHQQRYRGIRGRALPATPGCFIAEANARLEPYYSSTLFLVSATGGSPTLLLPDFPYAIEHASWTEDGRSILAVANMGLHSEVFSVDVSARTAKALTDGRHSVQFWSLVPAAGRMVFQFDEPSRLGMRGPCQSPAARRPRVTGLYDSLDRDAELPRQEKVSWKGADGVTIEGLLFYPSGYQAGRHYPLVVQLHSGPQESDKFGYGPGVILNYVPVLTAKGYAVLRPNYRGSTGYAARFFATSSAATSGTCTSMCWPAWTS